MAKVIKLGKVSTYKKLPECPFAWDDMREVCRSFGIQITHPAGKNAIIIAKTIVEHEASLKVAPKEYVIIDSGSLTSQMPLCVSKRIIISQISDLGSAFSRLERQVIKENISCFNLVIYYTSRYDSLLMQIENLHDHY